MTLETLRAQVTNPVVLRNVMQKLGLEERGYTEEELRKAIEAKTIKDSNLIDVAVTGPDPELVRQIADTVSREFIAFIDLTLGQQIGRAADFIREQIRVEEQKLVEATKEYTDFLSQPRGVVQLQKEVEAKLELVADFRKRLAENELQRESVLKRLEAARSRLAATPRTLTTKQSLLKNPTMLVLAGQQNGEVGEQVAGLQVESEELNPVYLALSQELAMGELLKAQLGQERENLLHQIGQLEKDLSRLQSELAVKQAEQDKLVQKVELLRNHYESFFTKAEEARVSSSMRLGEIQVMHISEAGPAEPVSPRIPLNAAVAGVLGLMVSVLLVLFRDYWRRSSGWQSA
ncbi:MAG: hypothetical protein NUV99_09665 [Clostridia bacterium]|jgi:uncharacterized protein involved in exopolysaccharide biosynthesis|nr:hypothetical protein [Clostridia bacterium]